MEDSIKISCSFFNETGTRTSGIYAASGFSVRIVRVRRARRNRIKAERNDDQ